MSLIGVYPDINEMNKEQLIEYIIFLEAQAVTKELEQEREIDYLKSIILMMKRHEIEYKTLAQTSKGESV